MKETKDLGICNACHRVLSSDELTIDSWMSVSKLSNDEIEQIGFICFDCFFDGLQKDWIE